jgi:hypothetical protein
MLDGTVNHFHQHQKWIVATKLLVLDLADFMLAITTELAGVLVFLMNMVA